MPKSMTKNIEKICQIGPEMMDTFININVKSLKNRSHFGTCETFFVLQSVRGENYIITKWTILKFIKNQSQNNANSMLDKTMLQLYKKHENDPKPIQKCNRIH